MKIRSQYRGGAFYCRRQCCCWWWCCCCCCGCSSSCCCYCGRCNWDRAPVFFSDLLVRGHARDFCFGCGFVACFLFSSLLPLLLASSHPSSDFDCAHFHGLGFEVFDRRARRGDLFLRRRHSHYLSRFRDDIARHLDAGVRRPWLGLAGGIALKPQHTDTRTRARTRTHSRTTKLSALNASQGHTRPHAYAHAEPKV